ncbi:MAG: DNA recombination protein RmuC [Ruminococcus sp.]|nr:DNA recombination protein RmuC [Ruminococcus sp.]
MDIVILILVIILIALAVIAIVKLDKVSKMDSGESSDKLLEEIKSANAASQRELREEISASIQTSVKNLGEMLSSNQKSAGEAQSEKITDMNNRINQKLSEMDKSLSEKQQTSSDVLAKQLKLLETRFQTLEANNESKLDAMRTTMTKHLTGISEENSKKLDAIQTTVNAKLESMNNRMIQKLSEMDKSLSEKQQTSSDVLAKQLKLLETRFQTLEANNESKLDAMRTTMTKHLTGISEENSKKLDAIQTTVNEKLESKMNESFKLVSERLEQVYKGLGEMQNIASGVGDLKKVLSNVKNRGILGEIQLGAILEDILAPEQYDKDIATIPGSANRVEFAVRLPGGGDEKCVYLPIDSKFPGDTYAALQDAYDSGNTEAIAAAKKNLQNVVKKCAKDIRDKYVEPPYTTNFGVMFLPFEGLYSEVVSSGMIETLQRDYNVSVAGPSTMAAMLNSLQMGFQTLAIQKRSSQVWEILGAVKSEFQTFGKALEDTQKHIKKVDEDLDKLVGVRTRQINRKLSSVESLDSGSPYGLLPEE